MGWVFAILFHGLDAFTVFNSIFARTNGEPAGQTR